MSSKSYSEMTPEEQVSLQIIHTLTWELASFVGECMDEEGKPKAPSKKALIDARKLLPAAYPHTLIK